MQELDFIKEILSYNKRKNMSIKILKLVSGDDVIATIGEGDGIVLEKPIRLMSYPDPETDSMGFMFVPWCPYSSEKVFKIAPIHIITTTEEEDVDEQLIREYRERFGSGITTPPTDLIL